MPIADAAAEVMARADEGLPKLWTIHQALTLCGASVRSGSARRRVYVPLAVGGGEGGARHRLSARRS